METDAGGLWWRHLQPRLRLCFKWCPGARGNHTFYSQSFGIKVLEVICILLDAATRIVLISITYQSHRAGSVLWIVRRSLGHYPSHISSRSGQDPTQIRTWDYHFLQKLRVKNSRALTHSAELPPSKMHTYLYRVIKKMDISSLMITVFDLDSCNLVLRTGSTQGIPIWSQKLRFLNMTVHI